jgi:3-oxoacyl-[acyl-carrier-protein] synthase-1
MTSIYVAGAALVSARGADLAQAVEAVRAGTIDHGACVIPSIDGDRTIPYFAMPVGDATEILVRTCRAALSDADLGDVKDIALIVGSSSLQIAEAERDASARVVGDMSTIARRVKAALAIEGCDYTVNTACTSSAHALLMAHTLVRAGACRAALVLGIEFANLVTAAGFQAMQLLGTSARPFDVARDGMVLGEAAAAIVLTAESSAPAPRLLGGANSIDTSSPTGADASGAAMTTLMRRALERAGVTTRDIGLIKAQAAGSRANDAVEALALAQLFDNVPAVTSLKGYVGHLLGASGCAELALLVGCWRAGFTPAAAGCDTPDPALPLRPMDRHSFDVPRYALLNTVGFGGGQAAIVLDTAAP